MRLLVLISLMLFIICNVTIAQDTSCGIVWYPPIQLSDSVYDAGSPKVTLTGDDTVHIVWERISIGSNIRLPYRRSTDGGITFEPERELITDSVTYPFSTFWNYITSQENEIFVFCVGGQTVNRTPIHMLRSHDTGSSWDSVKNIADSVGVISSVAMYGDTIGIIHSIPGGYRKFTYSTDNGLSWNYTTDSLSASTTATLTSGAVHITYQVGIDDIIEIEYRISHDVGKTWDRTTVISDIDGYDSDVPMIGSSQKVGDPPVVVAAWRDAKYGYGGILGGSIANRTGITTGDSIVWNQEEILTEFPRGYPRDIKVRGTTRVVAWMDEIVANKIFHPVTRMSKNINPSVWCPPIDHNPLDTNGVIIMQVAFSNKGFHVVWEESPSRTSTFRVFYQRGEFVSSGIENKNTTPDRFSLSQNYPNPFNPKTVISFTLHVSSFMLLKVYDVFGREVAVLVNGKQDAGEHHVEWNASHLASGIYFYRILTNSFTMTKKAVLLK